MNSVQVESLGRRGMTDHPDDDDHNHNGMSHYSTQAITPLSKALQEIYKLGGWALVLMLTFLVLVFAAFFLAESGNQRPDMSPSA